MDEYNSTSRIFFFSDPCVIYVQSIRNVIENLSKYDTGRFYSSKATELRIRGRNKQLFPFIVEASRTFGKDGFLALTCLVGRILHLLH